MRRRFESRTLIGLALTAVIVAVALWIGLPRLADRPGPQNGYRAPRLIGTPHPDLNGIWQALNTANHDLRSHEPRQALAVESLDGRDVPAAPVVALGGIGIVPGGLGVVDGGEIPYQPWAAAQQRDNFTHALTRDPEVKCFMPGVPRATYLPYPFQIVQTESHIFMAYEFQKASRTVHMKDPGEAPVGSWMGWSKGRWDGETLVVDVTGLSDQTWFDRAGNFHSDALHVVERYTRIGPDHLQYEATMDDPKVFTRPWTIRMPLYRRLEPNAELVDNDCVYAAEELLYGHMRRVPAKRWEGDFGERGGRMVIDIHREVSRLSP